MSKNSVFVLVVFSFCATSALAESCLQKLTNANKYMEANTACVKSLKLNASDVLTTPEEFKEKHFDDKCMSNCTLESLNFYRNGTFLKDNILEEFKKNAPSTEVYDKLAKVVETCLEVVNKKPNHNHNGGEKKNKKATKESKEGKSNKMHLNHQHQHKGCVFKCKKAAKFLTCVMENDKEC